MAAQAHKRNYTLEEFKSIASHFDIPGIIYMAYPYGSGHINDTFVVESHHQGMMKRYTIQRINTDIFKKPVEVMDNIKLVTEKLHESIKARGGNPLEESLTLVNNTDGLHHWKSDERDYWRCYLFIEGACTYNFVLNNKHGNHIAYEAAYAFGKFQRELVDLPGKSLHETIPFFHHTPQRFQQLKEALKVNHQNRKKTCTKEIEFALERENITSVLVDLMEEDTLPVRSCHNDTKINNVMFDYRGKFEKAKVIIDLDTLMPGTSLYDFGDLVRTTTCPAAEDEKDLTKVIFEIDLYESLVKGFLAAVVDILTEAELKHLAFSGILITYNMGLRFLADYLRGDTYYKIHRKDHNLDRARTQFKLIAEMEKSMERMEEIVRKVKNS